MWWLCVVGIGNAREMGNCEGNPCYSTCNVYKLLLIGYK